MSDDKQDDRDHNETRRDLFKKGGVLALGAGVAGTVAAPALAGHDRPPPAGFFPKFFPRRRHHVDLELAGKFVVVTGASRGIGRATADAMMARGAVVIGTSRDVANVPNPPAFPLLDLDVSSETSIAAFVGALTSHPAFPGSVDILINNGARFIIGTAVPPPIAPDPLGYFMDATNLGMDTVYGGQVRLTTAMLPLMSAVYARIMFTCSIAGYTVGGSEPGEANGQSFFHAYYSAKRALLGYANNLRGFMRASGSHIQVSTVNPYFVSTGLSDGLNPVFTEPVDANGNSPFNPFLQQVLDGLRQAIAFGLPPELVAEAFVQLAEMAEPVPNVIAAARRGALATAGGNELIEDIGLEENAEGAVTLGVPGKRRGHR